MIGMSFKYSNWPSVLLQLFHAEVFFVRLMWNLSVWEERFHFCIKLKYITLDGMGKSFQFSYKYLSSYMGRLLYEFLCSSTWNMRLYILLKLNTDEVWVFSKSALSYIVLRSSVFSANVRETTMLEHVGWETESNIGLEKCVELVYKVT
jgi:hypothetical protein